MTSLIPKVSVGVNSRKYRRNQSCMVHGTSEIGYVFPTYARNYINDATINLGTRTGVRLSPLFVPTMGKLDVRHYHCFVPWNRVYAPFDAFLAREPFRFGSSGSAIPSRLPQFKVGEILNGMFQLGSILPDGRARGLYSGEGAATFGEWVSSGAFNVGLTASIYMAYKNDLGLPGKYELWNPPSESETSEMVETLNYFFRDANWNEGASDRPYGYYNRFPCFAIMPSMIRFGWGDYFLNVNMASVDYSSEDLPNVTNFTQVSDNGDNHVVSDYLSSISYPSLEAHDFSYEFTLGVDSDRFFKICFNFNGALKRLRSIFLGLGYSFNPWDYEPDTPLKLFAYYRAWFSLFGVTRDINFNDTACAGIYRIFSDTNLEYENEIRLVDSYFFDTDMPSLFNTFLHDLCDLTYTCPADYFTSSIQNTQQGVKEDDIDINVGNTGYQIASARANADLSPSALVGVGPDGASYVSAISIKIAQRLLSWVNKNTVVGRKIQDILYARYGKIQTDDDSTEGVIKVGVDTTPIEIGIIFNQTSGEGSAPLGEFSGVGSGGSRSAKHTFVTPSYGVFITLTAVVPEMGYFQGKLRENSDGVADVLDFPDSAYDALGYQSVRYNELVADRQFGRYLEPDSASTSLGVYGRQSRYAHYKVGFNRVLGDISLPHMRDSMLAYTLDRYFNPKDSDLPVNNPWVSRKGTVGGTNRIFEVVSPTDDHIIYQIYFDINVNDRLKPMSLSYDTILDNDNKSVDFTHQ